MLYFWLFFILMLFSNHLSLSLSFSLTFSNFCSFSLTFAHIFVNLPPSPSLGLSFILFHLHLKISTSHSFQIKICFFFLYCICSKSPFLIVSSTLVGITTSQAAKERGEEFCHHRWSEVDWLSLSLFRPSLFLSFCLSLMWRQQKIHLPKVSSTPHNNKRIKNRKSLRNQSSSRLRWHRWLAGCTLIKNSAIRA